MTVEEEAGGLSAGKRQAETEEGLCSMSVHICGGNCLPMHTYWYGVLGTPPDEDEDILSDMDEGEGDASATKQRSKKQQVPSKLVLCSIASLLASTAGR